MKLCANRMVYDVVMITCYFYDVYDRFEGLRWKIGVLNWTLKVRKIHKKWGLNCVCKKCFASDKNNLRI